MIATFFYLLLCLVGDKSIYLQTSPQGRSVIYHDNNLMVARRNIERDFCCENAIGS